MASGLTRTVGIGYNFLLVFRVQGDGVAFGLTRTVGIGYKKLNHFFSKNCLLRRDAAFSAEKGLPKKEKKFSQ